MRSGQASWTARRVAAQRLEFRRVPADHGRPEDEQRLQADVAEGVERGDFGMTRYLAARTAFVDRSVVRALDAGTPQALILGAGYDGRSLRYGGRTWRGSSSTTRTRRPTSVRGWPGSASPGST
ncbi:MAG: hypothetical protein GEV28_07515 [Actinophytocola sp.]|nr:hypothetical protein [Actinophytocola sp.]